MTQNNDQYIIEALKSAQYALRYDRDYVDCGKVFNDAYTKVRQAIERLENEQ